MDKRKNRIQDMKVVNIGQEGEHDTGQEGGEYWT